MRVEDQGKEVIGFLAKEEGVLYVNHFKIKNGGYGDETRKFY